MCFFSCVSVYVQTYILKTTHMHTNTKSLCTAAESLAFDREQHSGLIMIIAHFTRCRHNGIWHLISFTYLAASEWAKTAHTICIMCNGERFATANCADGNGMIKKLASCFSQFVSVHVPRWANFMLESLHIADRPHDHVCAAERGLVVSPLRELCSIFCGGCVSNDDEIRSWSQHQNVPRQI